MIIHFYDTSYYGNVLDEGGEAFHGTTLGWKKVSYVQYVTEDRNTAIYIGLQGTGTIWIDDVSVERVDASTPGSAPHFVE